VTFVPDPGSIHDPTSRVYVSADRVVRGLDATAAADLAEVLTAGFFVEAAGRGAVVPTQLLDQVPADLASDGWVGALEHERLPFISYPYEWTFSMLRDAALLSLELVEAALDEGFITKDATPYNVQFDGTRPVFIDVGSFERVRKGEPWFGYRQFCEMFLNPLLIQAKTGLSARQLLRGSLGGVSPAATQGALPRGTRMRPSVFTQVSLHAWAERKYAGNDDDVKGDLAKAGFGPTIIRAQVRKLHKLTTSVRWKQQRSTWSDYSERSHYEDQDLARKEEFCRSVAAERPRRLVVDFGANDGHFTKLVLPHCERALAVDNDELVVDRLYSRLRHEGETRIQPLCIDLADPSGGLGWRSIQRAPFLDRLRPDLVLFLAVIHHLAISNSIPIPQIVDMLADLGGDVVLEFPLPEDPKVVRLLRNKATREFPGYDQPTLEKALERRFDVVAQERLPSGTRVLYHLARPR
jgi:hypothetical protein